MYLPLFVVWGFPFLFVPICTFLLTSLWWFLSCGLVSSLPVSPVLELPYASRGSVSSASVESPVPSATGSSLWAESVAVGLLCTHYSSLVFSLTVGLSLSLPPPDSVKLLPVCGPLLVVRLWGVYLLLHSRCKSRPWVRCQCRSRHLILSLTVFSFVYLLLSTRLPLLPAVPPWSSFSFWWPFFLPCLSWRYLSWGFLFL